MFKTISLERGALYSYLYLGNELVCYCTGEPQLARNQYGWQMLGKQFSLEVYIPTWNKQFIYNVNIFTKLRINKFIKTYMKENNLAAI